MDETRHDALLRSISARGLPGLAEPDPIAVPDAGWVLILGRVRAQRITGAAMESVAEGWLQLTDEQTEQLLSAHRRAMTWCLSVERKLVVLSEAFQDAGIPHAVLKGPSIAHSAYPEPCLRSFADLDLLVPTCEYERACALLDGTGHRRRLPEPRPRFDVRFGKASVHTHPDDGIEVDLHRTLVLGPFGLWLDPEELLDHLGSFWLGGRSFPRLDDTGMLLNVALHAALGWSPPRLVPLRDVLQVSSAGDVEWDRLARWARDWRLAGALKLAFMTASDALAAPVPAAARGILVDGTPRRETRALRAYKGERRSHGGISIATLSAISGIRPKAAYVSALVAPHRQFVAARGGVEGTSYVRRWSVLARWATRWISGHGRRTRGR
jgi:hypothetical protein